MDLTAVSRTIDKYGNKVYGTGISIEIPKWYVGLLFPRSSISKKTLSLANAVGVVDSGYRGELIFKFKPTPQFENNMNPMNFEKEDMVYDASYEIGDRIGQIIILPYPQIEFEEVSELDESERGIDGFGSTGK